MYDLYSSGVRWSTCKKAQGLNVKHRQTATDAESGGAGPIPVLFLAELDMLLPILRMHSYLCKSSVEPMGQTAIDLSGNKGRDRIDTSKPDQPVTVEKYPTNRQVHRRVAWGC